MKAENTSSNRCDEVKPLSGRQFNVEAVIKPKYHSCNTDTVQENKVGGGQELQLVQNPTLASTSIVFFHVLSLFFSVCRKQDCVVWIWKFTVIGWLVFLQEDVPPSPLRWTTAPATRPASSPSPSAARWERLSSETFTSEWWNVSEEQLRLVGSEEGEEDTFPTEF